ncbi:hypothetical protein QBC40DRAFT_329935 [Triangularia verruculosa]|uniref:Uncharacterized protein n=1 Tax=Triangularia verruculosa TaxID=2587418 RepID=A0AAN6XEF3_9PEZI|nr:hypothetical protein QBC40DRAFT_329935 [Triangularia verruculosa]
MPAQGRNTAAPSLLPPVDSEATAPFSDLFNNGFDRATIDATLQFVDRNIIIAPNGRRYRLEEIPDPVPGQLPSPASSSPASRPVSPSVSPPGYQAAPTTRAPPIASRAPPVTSSQSSFLSYKTFATWGRSSSNANSHSFSSPRRSNPAPQPPQSPVHETTTMMAQLSAGSHFGANPLYGQSDGGVQAAEALTDPYMGVPGVAPTTPRTSTASPRGPRGSISQVQQQQQPSSPQHYLDAPGQYAQRHPRTSSVSSGSGSTPQAPWSSPDYVGYTQQAIDASRQVPTTTTGLPSLLGESIPIVSSSPSTSSISPTLTTLPASSSYSSSNSQYLHQYYNQSQPHPRKISDPSSPLTPSPAEVEKELYNGPGIQGHHHYPPLYHHVPSTDYSAPPTAIGSQPSYSSFGVIPTQEYGGGGEYDTLTPVVVMHPMQSTTDIGGTTPRIAPSMLSSDGGSTGRDNVLPGEDLVYDGPVKSAHSLTQPQWQEGVLKVFRNNLTNDLRFHCKAPKESETYWMKSVNAQLVPAYAYDQRLSNVVYIRDKESDQGPGNGYMQSSSAGGSGRPSGIYQFDNVKGLFDFQARLTSQKVVLDIQSVKLVTLNKSGSREIEKYSGVRLQIWHESNEGGRRSGGGPSAEVASFVTAGTALSGPLRERLVASSSRLMVYLGRSGEYITLFITDDLDIKLDGQTIVKLKPRKGPGPFTRRVSRWPGVKAHMEKGIGSEPAGLNIHGQIVEQDVEKYDLYKTFEIEFENSPSQDNFVRKWKEVLHERRRERQRLEQIQEEMTSTGGLHGRQARELFW